MTEKSFEAVTCEALMNIFKAQEANDVDTMLIVVFRVPTQWDFLCAFRGSIGSSSCGVCLVGRYGITSNFMTADARVDSAAPAALLKILFHAFPYRPSRDSSEREDNT